MGSVVYAVSIGVAFLNAYAFLALQAALAVYYALDPLSRRAGRRPAPVGDDRGADAPEPGPDVGYRAEA